MEEEAGPLLRGMPPANEPAFPHARCSLGRLVSCTTLSRPRNLFSIVVAPRAQGNDDERDCGAQ